MSRILIRRLFVAVLISGVVALYMLASASHPTFYSEGSELSAPASVKLEGLEQEVFRVAILNIHRGKGLDDRRDLHRIGEVLRGADIIGLQEVAGTLFYGWDDQAEQLAEQLSLGWVFGPARFQWFQPHVGNALLSKFQVSSWSNQPLPLEEGENYRGLLTATVPAGTKELTLLVTHVDRDEMKAKQLEFVLDIFLTTPPPVILIGDLNVFADNQEIQSMLAEDQVIDGIEQAIGPYERLDWILMRGVSVEQGGYTPRGVSDHEHYWLDVKIDQTERADQAELERMQ